MLAMDLKDFGRRVHELWLTEDLKEALVRLRLP